MSASSQPELQLYYRGFCFFCSRVKRTINQLELEVEGKDIWKDALALRELQQATGRTTVPVLKIMSQDGEVTWMPESIDIVQYLNTLNQR